MKTIDVFVVDEDNQVVQDNKYNVVKVIKDSYNALTFLGFDFDGDFAIVKAAKDYSVNPFRYIVRRKVLIPFWFQDEEDE